METVMVMKSEIEGLREHFDRIIEETIIPKMDRLESKVDSVDSRVRETNGRVRAIEVWQARIQGGAAVAGRSWQSIIAIGSVSVAIISVVLANT